MDETSVTTGQDSGQAAEQASATTATNAAQTATQTTEQPAPQTINEQAIQSELKRARDEAAAKRVEAVELKTKLEASIAEAERLKSEHAALQQRATTLEAERAMAMIAADAIYPDLLIKQVDVKSVLDDKGAVDSAKVASEMARLRTEYPNMFRGTGGDAASKPMPNQPNFDNMSQSEYERWRKEQGY